MQVNFDESQLEKIMSSLKPQSTKKVTLDSFIKFLQILSIVVTAFWGLYLYITYDKEKRRLDLESAKLTIQRNRQDSILKEIDLETVKTRTNLDIERTIQQQKLASIQLKYSEEDYKLNVLLKQNDAEFKDLHLKYAKDVKISPKDSFTVRKIKDIDEYTGLYKVTLSIHLKNESSNAVEVSYSILDAYLLNTNLSDTLKNITTVPSFQLVNFPPSAFYPDRWEEAATETNPLSTKKTEITKWVPFFSKCYIYPLYKYLMLYGQPDLKLYLTKRPNCKIEDGTGLTGVYNPGEEDNMIFEFNVTASKNNYVGLVFSYALNRGQKSEYLRALSFKKDLKTL